MRNSKLSQNTPQPVLFLLYRSVALLRIRQTITRQNSDIPKSIAPNMALSSGMKMERMSARRRAQTSTGNSKEKSNASFFPGFEHIVYFKIDTIMTKIVDNKNAYSIEEAFSKNCLKHDCIAVESFGAMSRNIF